MLRYGRASRYAAWLDIHREAQPRMASGLLVVPATGRP